METREERRQRMEKLMVDCMAEPIDFNEHPRPWTWGIAYYDGWFYQFIDANGKPCLGNDLREPDDAAMLLRLINHLST